MNTSYYNYLDVIMNMHDTPRVESPESLREQAAKLEAKAKELEKPKLTDKQQYIVDKAHCELGYPDIIHWGSQPSGYYRYFSSGRAADSLKYIKVISSGRVTSVEKGYELRVMTLLDEEGEIISAIDIDY